MSDINPRQTAYEKAANTLTKWRNVFAGWQLGTRLKGDPEGDAVRDHREVTMIMRAELSALAQLLIKKGVFTGDEWLDQNKLECELLSKIYERAFPGFKATDYGMQVDVEKSRETTKNWRM